MHGRHRERWRRALAAAALGLSLLAAASTVRAQDPGAEIEEPPKSIAQSREDASKAVADRMVAFGDWCVQRLYRRFAVEQFEAALQFVPDHAAARQRLGFRREGQRWVQSVKRPAHVDATVKSPQAAAIMETELRRAYEQMAKSWEDHARHCDWMGDDAAARGAWYQVLYFDPAHAEARKEAGLNGDAPAWRLPVTSTPRIVSRRVEALAARLRAKDRGIIKETALSAERGGLTAISEDHPPGASPRRILATMIITGDLLKELGLLPADKGPGKFTIHHVSTERRYRELVDECSRMTKEDRSRDGNLSGFWWSHTYFVKRASTSAPLLDSAAHKSAEQFFQTVNGIADIPAWLEEGLAYLASSIVEGTAIVHCVSFEGTGIRKELPADKAWDDVAREDIEAGLDPPLAEFFVSGINDLSVPSMVKSRSLLLWLSEGDPGITLRLAKASVQGRLPRAEAERVFGAPLEAVDREWRLWARRP